jgi:predicted metal-dependent hydrolase
MDMVFEDVPRHWLFGDPVPTAVINALSLLFPSGERFFIRSVKRYEDAIGAPELKEAMRGFYGQEAQHQREHGAANRRLEAQGYELASFFAWWEHFAFERLEPRFPPAIRLAATAAVEHFTATFAGAVLSQRALDGVAHPAMAHLLYWHASEEIEHKSVAFDVLQVVDPRYRTRLGGFSVALPALLYGWLVGVRHLLAQEPRPFPPRRRSRDGRTPRLVFAVVRGVADYLRPGFHPEQHDNRPLARAYLASVGRPS